MVENNTLLSHVLPREVIEYFEITKIEDKGKELHIYLEEKNTVPLEAAGKKLESKGFYSPKEIQDFPLRGKPLFLKVKRRRWRDKETGGEIVRDWGLVAKGTKYTQEFADFLKELAGD